MESWLQLVDINGALFFYYYQSIYLDGQRQYKSITMQISDRVPAGICMLIERETSNAPLETLASENTLPKPTKHANIFRL